MKIDEKFTDTSKPQKLSEADLKLRDLYLNLGKLEEQQLFICVGAPGSGKSTFFREYLCPKFKRINNDTIKNPKKAIELCKQALTNKESVIVDNLNASAATRAVYIKLGEE